MPSTAPFSPTRSAIAPANRPTPQYRSSAISPLRGIRPCITAFDQGVGGLRVDLPEAAHADAVGAAVGALADEGAAVDAVDAAVLLLDAQDRDRLVEFDQRAGGRPGCGVRTTWRSCGAGGGDRLDRRQLRPLALLDAQFA